MQPIVGMLSTKLWEYFFTTGLYAVPNFNEMIWDCRNVIFIWIRLHCISFNCRYATCNLRLVNNWHCEFNLSSKSWCLSVCLNAYVHLYVSAFVPISMHYGWIKAFVLCICLCLFVCVCQSVCMYVCKSSHVSISDYVCPPVCTST